MAQDLFKGHSYNFKKDGDDLVLANSTDNSHETATFREGLISSGSVVINTEGNVSYAMKVYNYDTSLYSAADRGIEMRVGDDGAAGVAYFMYFLNGDGTYVGRIRGSGATLYYDTFTGVHKVSLLDSDSVSANIIPPAADPNGLYNIYEEGVILSLVKSEIQIENGEQGVQPIEYCVTSSTHQDKRVLGVYVDSDPDISNELGDYHTCCSLGDGVILVSNQNGNIENGDYITTASGSGGYGCNILHNYTVAKSLEDVDWSTEESSSKLVGCTYHCG